MENAAEVQASLGLVGINEASIMGAAEALARIPSIQLRKGEGILIKPLKKSGQQRQGPSRRFSLSGSQVTDPTSVRYFTVDEQADGYGLELSDILLLDVSHAGSAGLVPFWDQLVIYELDMEFYSGVEGGKNEYLMGYLILREERVQPRGQSLYNAEVKPWIGADYSPSFIHTEKLYKTRAAFEGYGGWGFPIGSWRGESSPAMGSQRAGTSAIPDAVKHARSEVRASPEKGRILGRVIGWFRGPSLPGS
jgi:hypothetical protein